MYRKGGENLNGRGTNVLAGRLAGVFMKGLN